MTQNINKKGICMIIDLDNKNIIINNLKIGSCSSLQYLTPDAKALNITFEDQYGINICHEFSGSVGKTPCKIYITIKMEYDCDDIDVYISAYIHQNNNRQNNKCKLNDHFCHMNGNGIDTAPYTLLYKWFTEYIYSNYNSLKGFERDATTILYRMASRLPIRECDNNTFIIDNKYRLTCKNNDNYTHYFDLTLIHNTGCEPDNTNNFSSQYMQILNINNKLWELRSQKLLQQLFERCLIVQKCKLIKQTKQPNEIIK